MPNQKDLKRLIRNRMQKTGESYTAARSQIVKSSPGPAEYAGHVAPVSTVWGSAEAGVDAERLDLHLFSLGYGWT